MSFIGIIVLALGLATIVKANVGFDPWGILFNGMLNAYNKVTPDSLHVLKYGDMITIISTLFVFIASAMRKAPIKWLSIISGFLLGQFVNIWVGLWLLVDAPSLSIASIDIMPFIILAFGIITLSLGSIISLHFSVLMSPVDYLILTIKDRFPNHTYGLVRIGADTSAVIIGVLITLLFTQNIFATQVNIGTVIMFFGVGYVINLLMPIVSPLLKQIKKACA